MNRSSTAAEHSSLEYLEEAFGLLLRGGVRALIPYYLGTLPFVLALLYFTAEMSTGAFAASHLAEGALLVSLAFGWMKAGQAFFARHLLSVLGEPQERLSFRQTIRLGIIQYAVHATGLFLLPIGLAIALPFGWLYAFYQDFTASADAAPLKVQLRRAARRSLIAPKANHAAISLFSLAAFFLFLNLCILTAYIPFLIRAFTGIETLMNQNWTSLLNTTVLLLVIFATYLLLDPFIKAFYVLRSFRIRSQSTGRDLLVRLHRLRRPSPASALLIALLLGFFTAVTPSAQGAEPPVNPPPRGEQIDRSISEILTRPEFAWRAPREIVKDEGGQSWIVRSVRWAFQQLEDLRDKWKDEIDAIIRWFLDKKPKDESKPLNIEAIREVLTKLLYAFCIIIVVIAAYLIWRSWRRGAKAAPAELATTPMAPDLNHEEVSAEQLPPEEWEALAGEMIARGEYRLATRAFYLSGLAHLNSRDWISLRRAKSNRELRREITRRAPMHPELIELFRQNVLNFEKVWYGNTPATSESIADSRTTLHHLRRF